MLGCTNLVWNFQSTELAGHGSNAPDSLKTFQQIFSIKYIFIFCISLGPFSESLNCHCYNFYQFYLGIGLHYSLWHYDRSSFIRAFKIGLLRYLGDFVGDRRLLLCFFLQKIQQNLGLQLSPVVYGLQQLVCSREIGSEKRGDHVYVTKFQNPAPLFSLKQLHCIEEHEEGNGTPLQYSCLANPMDGGAWWATVHGVAKSQTQLSDFTFTLHFHELEKEMATHSSVIAWRIQGTGEPGGLLSMGSHRVGHA